MGKSAPPDAGVRPGDVLAGKYRVERVLGVGGMGVVVAAQHLQLDERVALKFLLPQALHSAESIGRFMREARAAVKIKSEHVARVTDVGQLDNGAPYIVMEYLEGSDLHQMLNERGPMPVAQAVDFLLQACEALADAHVLGIVHRDLKPANLFCIRRSDGQPSIKVLDFGISKITTPGAPGHDLTHTTALMGSPLYMSPEQMQASKGVDVRTDIWALGVILFELIAGSPPFTAEAVTELAIKVANEPAPAVRSVRFDAPEGVERVIAKCLEKHRAARFQNVGELALALRDFGSRSAQISVERILGTLRQAGATPPSADDSQQVIVVARGSSPAIAATGPTEASWGQTAAEPTPKPGGRARLGFAIAAVVAILAAGGVLALRRPAPPSAAASVAPTALPPPVLPASPSSSALPAAPPPPAPAASSAVAAAQPTAPSAKPAASPARPASTTSAGPPSHKPNCNPPYVIDSAGDRQYKPECL